MIIIYFIKATVCMAIFYLVFRVFLSRLTFFGLNRVYLLGTLILSLLIPALKFEIKKPYQEAVQQSHTDHILSDAKTQVTKKITVNSLGTLPVPPSSNIFSSIDFRQFVFGLYLLVTLYLAIKLVIIMARIIIRTRRYGIKQGKYLLVNGKSGLTNCSLFNIIFIDENISETEKQQVIAHEAEHGRRLHSADRLFIEILRIIMWFNPFIYLYRNALEQVHEYEADMGVCRTWNRQDYADLLFRLCILKQSTLVNHFSGNSLKNRVSMLFTNPSRSMQKLMYISALPAAFLMLWLFAVEIVYAKPAKSSFKTDNPAKDLSTTTVKEIPEKLIVSDIETTSTKPEDSNKISSDLLLPEISVKISAISRPLIQKEIESATTAIFSELVDAIIPRTTRKPEQEKFRVVLDPGHGGKLEGAIIDGIHEKDLNLEISKEIRKVLEGQGYEVIMTREGDENILIKERVKIKGDIFLSVHMNMAGPGSKFDYSGIGIYTSRMDDAGLYAKSKILAQAFEKGLGEIRELKINSTAEKSLAILRGNMTPAITLDLGFMTNKQDLDFLMNKDNHKKIANAFISAIRSYREMK